MTEIEPVYNKSPFLDQGQLYKSIRDAQEGIRAKERLRGGKPISWDNRQTLEQAVRRGEEAFEQIIGSNLDRVYREARKVTGLLPWGELEQAGVWGIYSAVNSFDPEKNVSFATHVTNHIRWAILDSITIHHSQNAEAFKNTRMIRDFEQRYTQTHGHRPSVEEIASELGLRNDRIKELRAHSAISKPLSINDPIKEGSDTTWEDFLRSDTTPPEEAAETLEIFQMVIDYLKGRGGVVPEHILMLVQHIWGYMTYEEIGKAHGVTKQRVEQILNRLYTLLEYPLRDYKPPKRKLR